MADVRSARKPRDPIELALRLALEEALETRRRRELEHDRQRAKMRLVEGGARREVA